MDQVLQSISVESDGSNFDKHLWHGEETRQLGESIFSPSPLEEHLSGVNNL